MKSYQILFVLLWATFHLHMSVSMTTKREKVDHTPQGIDGDADEPIPSPFSDDEIEEMVDWHNYARSIVIPAASNMEYMNWDPQLQHIAQQWAEECKWMHGQPSDVTTYYGQNLYAGSARLSVTPKGIIKRWVDENTSYNYTTNTCRKRKVCGHYTQVVWSTTTSLGCGRALCPNLEGAGKNMYMVVCQYSPAGNVVGYSPYANGPPCSKCRSGIGQCYESLCRSCEEHDEICECRQICRNCGTVDMETCQCNCPQGYRGTDCSETCTDLHPYCGRSPGFPKQSCRFHSMIPKLCPLTCGSCVLAEDEQSCQETTSFMKYISELLSTKPEGGEVKNERLFDKVGPEATAIVTTAEPKTTERAEENVQEINEISVRQDEIPESNSLEDNEALEHNEPLEKF